MTVVVVIREDGAGVSVGKGGLGDYKEESKARRIPVFPLLTG